MMVEPMKQADKKEEKMTLDKLAGMVARGFQSVDQRFDALHQEVTEIKGDVSALKDDVADLKVSVRRIDLRTQNQVDAVFSDVTHLKKRVTVLEKRRA